MDDTHSRLPGFVQRCPTVEHKKAPVLAGDQLAVLPLPGAQPSILGVTELSWGLHTIKPGHGVALGICIMISSFVCNYLYRVVTFNYTSYTIYVINYTIVYECFSKKNISLVSN